MDKKLLLEQVEKLLLQEEEAVRRIKWVVDELSKCGKCLQCGKKIGNGQYCVECWDGF